MTRMKAALLLPLILCFAPTAVRARQTTATPEVVCQLCPTITVEGPEAVGSPGIPINLKAKVSGAGPLTTLTCKWTVSAGAITSGSQSSMSLTGGDGECAAVVDTTGVERFTKVESTVEVGGLDRSCSNRAAGATEVRGIIDPHPLDEYGANLGLEDERARLDNFAIELQEHPEMTGYIDCYGGRRGRQGEARVRCERAKNYLTKRRGMSSDRIVTVDGGFREQLTVVLWVLPSGSKFTSSPTVAPSEVEFTDAPKKRRPRAGPKRD